MAKELTVSISGLVIAVSLLLLLILFWVYARNVTHISVVVDRKKKLEGVVTTLSKVLENVGEKVDTVGGQRVDVQRSPVLATLLDSLEQVLILDDCDDSYIFICDTSGLELVNGGNPSLARRSDGSRPGTNLSRVEDAHGNKPVQKIINKAAEGGGFIEYQWKNKSGKLARKMSYVRAIPGTNWIIGCGMFVN